MDIDIHIAVDKKTGRPEQSMPIFYTEKSCQEWINRTPWTKKKLFAQKGKLTLPDHDYTPYICAA